jgi:PAS domain S-box-containing protein
MKMIKARLGFGLAAALLVLLASSVLSYWSIDMLMQNEEKRNDHSHGLLLLERISGSMSDLESKQRAGYITRNNQFEQVTKEAKTEILGYLDEYRSVMDAGSDPEVDSLEDAITKRCDCFLLTRKSFDTNDSIAFIASFNTGQEVMYDLKRHVNKLEAKAREQLEILHQGSERLSVLSRSVIVISLVIAFLLVAMAYTRSVRALKVKEEAAQRLRESEHFRNKITDIVPGLIAVYNIHTGKYLFVNDAIRTLLGYTREDVLKKGLAFFASLVHPDDATAIMQKNQEALNAANTDPAWNDLQPVNFEYRMRHSNGEYRWFLTSGLIFKRGADRKVEELINLSFDITESKLAEERLLKSEELLREAQLMANLGSWEWDITNNKITWTDELYRMYGYEPGSIDLQYETFLSHVHPEDREMVGATIEGSYSNKQPYSFEHRVVQPNGAVRTLLGKGRVIVNSEGQPVMMRGSTLDITDIKNTREELRIKDEFIGIASHELKTPLTSIKAYIQLLEQMMENSDTDALKLAYIRKSSSHIDRLNRLISDLLDVSKIQAGKLQFNISEFSIDDLVQESIESIQYTSNAHKIEIQGSAGVMIKGDKLRLEQAFVNFLTNAIKYSPKADKVIVNIGSAPGSVEVSVTDFGIGIPKEKVSKIFDRFYRVENTPHLFTGLGIGLYIASEIIQRHDGRIWVETEEGKGSTFHFTLPVNN